MEDRSKIADRVMKMMAKATGGASPEEAANIIAKVHEMLFANDMTMLDVVELDKTDPVVHDKSAREWWQSLGYMKALSNQVCIYYGAKAIYTTDRVSRKVKLSVIGRQSCVTTSLIMVDYLANEVRRLAAQGAKEGRYRTATVGLTAIANALSLRIHAMCKKAESARDKDVKNQLVPLDEIKLMTEREYGDLKSSKARTVKVSAAARSDAARVNLDLQVGGSKTSGYLT